MSKSEANDPTAEFAKELAKQLPVKEVYQDGAAPAVRQAGQVLQDLVKTLQLALAPIQYLGALQDRFRSFLDKAVREVPENRRVSPAPQILGPVIEAIRYEPEDSDVEKMFSKLLTSAMDTEKLQNAHPAIAPTLRQLSTDEVKILHAISDATKHFELKQRFDIQANGLTVTTTEDYGIPTAELSYPENIGLYIERLDKLGLVRFDAARQMQPTYAGGRQTGGYNYLLYKLSSFGVTFMTACGVQPKTQM